MSSGQRNESPPRPTPAMPPGPPPPPYPGTGYPPPMFARMDGPGIIPQYVSVTQAVIWGPYPQSVRCMYCGNFVLTRVTTTPSCVAHLACCMMFFLGCWLCSCIPYCLGGFQNTLHSCPLCLQVLGVCSGRF